MQSLLIEFVSFFQGRCNRDKPPCKYFHPPQHLKDQLLINGRNHLALKNAVLQQYGLIGAAGAAAAATGHQVMGPGGHIQSMVRQVLG